MLLRPVMEVALDLAALGVACGHDACTRGAELFVRRLELGRQTTVLDGQQQRLTRGCDELWVGVQSRVVPDHRHGFAVPRDRSRRLARRRRGRKRLAARVDKAAGLLESEPDLERWIIECIGQRRAQLSGARVLYQAGDDLLQRRRGEECAYHDRKHKSVGKQGATNREEPADVRDRAGLQIEMIADDAVEDQDGRRKHHGGYVDGNERAPARSSCRRQAVEQDRESPHSERERQVRTVAAEPVGDRRTVGDHEGVRGTRRVAAGNRPAAAHDGREEKLRKGRCKEGKRPSREQQPLRPAAKPSAGEGEDDIEGQDERREVTEHTDAVEQGIGRPLQRHDDRSKRQGHEREAEAIAGTSNQPVERRTGPSHDDHGPLDAVRNRIDEVVARREEQTGSDRDQKPPDRKRGQDVASRQDRRDRTR